MKILKNKKAIQNVSLIIAGIGVLFFFASLSSTRYVAEHSSILNLLGTAKITNHNLNENILRLRTYLLNTYDPVVRNVNKLQNVCKSMLTDSDYKALREGPNAETLNKYCASVGEKIELIERYKSQNSVMHNSIKYLPMLAATFENSKYSNDANTILAKVFVYALEPSETLQKEIALKTSQLPALSKNSKLYESINSLKLHTGIVLKHVEIRSELEKQILSSESAHTLAKIESEYLRIYQLSQRKGFIYYYTLILICIGLGGWLITLFQQLKKTGDSLKDVNINLEKKVAKRTQQLSEALEQLAENQQILMQSTKMTALGEMAGGIAHEINTPLSAILLNAQSLLENIRNPDQAQTEKRLNAIIKIVARVSKIIMGLKRFSRSSDQVEKEVCSISTIIEDTLVLCTEKMKSRSVELHVVEIDPTLKIKCVPEHISQVVLNFLNNSLDALQDQPLQNERWIRIEAATVNGYHEISVTDAGLGLPESVQAKLMQPFFTTKAPGHGTGLGLSISKGIVEQHGGTLFYDKNCPNTRFVIRVPAVKNEGLRNAG